MIDSWQSENSTRSERTRRGLVGLLVFQGLSAGIGGCALVADPSGAAIGFPTELLHGSPFTTYLVPGLVLLFVLGAGPLLVAYGVWTRRRWAPLASVLVGLALLIWLGVEILVVGFHVDPPVQPLYAVTGVAIALLGYSMSRAKQ